MKRRAADPRRCASTTRSAARSRAARSIWHSLPPASTRCSFVCGRKSSNGKVLFEVCRRANPRTYNIEEAAEIDPAWLAGAASVGICGATSTPRWLMQRVAEAVGALGRKHKGLGVPGEPKKREDSRKDPAFCRNFAEKT